LATQSDLRSRRERIFRPILVVDDDPFRAFARCTALERAFYGVTRAANAAEAFMMLEEGEFADKVAVVIVGLSLPGLAGPLFVSELNRRHPGTPILALGRRGEVAQDYPGRNVRFLPAQTSPRDILEVAAGMVSHARAA